MTGLGIRKMHPANKWLIGVTGTALLSGAMLWEGKRSTSYIDLANVLTVCYGHTGRDIIKGKYYTDAECSLLLKQDIKIHSDGVLQCVNMPLKENQYSAFVLMAYNVGVSGFCSSRALRLFNEGHTAEACRAMAYSPTGSPAWSFANGKFVQGLHNRRVFESNMCLGATHATPV